MNEQEKEYFSKIEYRPGDHRAARLYGRTMLSWFLERIKVDGSSLLEIGAGPGVFSFQLLKRSRRLVALDAFRNQLARNPAALRVAALGEMLPFRDDSFDFVLVANILHHVKRPVIILKEARRVSRRNVLLIEPNALNPAQVFFSLVAKEELGGLFSFPWLIEDMAVRAGLGVREMTGFGAFTQNRTPYWLARLLLPLQRSFFMGLYILAVLEPGTPQVKGRS
ncbi:MAG: class I SAM-dependent methyltransferase [Deltaproteobacteria bacterium]|nr:class I SAM-dependent methyltransferase [Deltaproteobacteria bacterium]